ncbi:Subtilisin-like protease SBT4.2 [Vitis vinifera]|uniref:Subtilisin-like protease SBT4.2 n=1 Tax=Vitis vinifera TaxID=29760 RepID=A0A438GLA2_VITVI|nr:Subtilisin-like protease SBT4.2 [Vitis vinifera]
MPNSLEVKVEPPVLSFSATGEKKSFSVRVDGPEITMHPIISGAILWKDGVHVVRTPLVVYTVLHQKLSRTEVSLNEHRHQT